MVVAKPSNIIYVGSPFYNPRVSGGRTYIPQAIVLHIADGTLVGTDAWFNNPAAQVSAHFCVGKAGEIHQYIYVENAAWANGIIEPGATAKILTTNNWQNPNLYTISVEHEGRFPETPATVQWDASVKLSAWLFSQYMVGVPVTRDSIIRHSEISSQTRANCPGWPENFVTTYVAQVKAAIASAPVVDPRITQARQLLDDVIAGR